MKLVVCHPSPAIRRAIVTGLSNAGIDASDAPDAASDISEWLVANHPAGAVLHLGHHAWSVLQSETPGSLMIALVDEDSVSAYSRAFVKRAAVVASTSWEVERIVHAIQDAIEGFSTLPFGVVQALAARSEGPPTDLVLSKTEVEALRLLCGGKTVVAISDRLSYSEREMHRILGGLYERMGAVHRAEAIVLATRWGLCDP